MDVFRQPTAFITSTDPDIMALADQFNHLSDERARAVAIYYWVRDEIRYNPYAFENDPSHLWPRVTMQRGEGWCVPKAVLMAALCRAVGLAAGVGFADVRNHLSTAKLRETMKTDVFYYHGYVSVYLEGQWVKATPAFNLSLCEKFNLKPLEFDGRSDSLYHPFDAFGQRHMEYILDRGVFSDVPVDDLYACYKAAYGDMTGDLLTASSWQNDVEQETSNPLNKNQ